jgi:ABC-type multidrug transport system ATPase subunit
MPVNYTFEAIHINSFRGIRELSIEFVQGSPLHIIGANNAGKSTVLEAIAFALRGGGFHQYDLGPYDFFRDAEGNVASEFEVRVGFKADQEELLPAVQGVGQPAFVHAVRAKGRTAGTGRISKHFNLLGRDGKAITFSPRTPIKGALKEQLSDHSAVGWAPTSARHDHIRNELPEVMLLKPSNVHQSLYTWKTGPLNRLASMLAEKFLDDEWSFEFGGQDRKMPSSLHGAHKFLSSAVEKFPFWQETLRPKLSDTLSRYLGRHSKIELKPSIQQIEDWLRQQLLLSFAADESGTITPIESMGDGWQSLIRLAALDVLSQFPEQMKERVVLLFEEPETHLHPHLRRRMRGVLETLAAGGWYVITTTHAPEFVDLSSNQRIVKLRRSGASVSHSVVDSSQATDAIKVQSKVNEQGNGELFFANKVVLCEGKDDEFALKTLMSMLNVDLDGRSVSILGIGGKGNVIDYARLLKSIGTAWCEIIDEDRRPDGTYKNNSEETLTQLQALKTDEDEICQWEIDLEHCFGIGRSGGRPDRPEHKADPDWQATQFTAQTNSNVESNYPKLFAVAKTARTWIEEGV